MLMVSTSKNSVHFAMDLLASLIWSFFLFVFLSCHAKSSLAHSIRIDSLLPSKSIDQCSSTPTVSYGDNHRMRIQGRRIICSPHHKLRSKSLQMTHHAFLQLDQSRATSFQARVSAARNPSTSGATIPDHPGFDLGTAEYVVTVGFGTPAKPFTVIMDTGSDISWIQCKPCVVQCYPQKQPLFDPSQSSSYSNVSCTDTNCLLVGDECLDSTCIYDVQYGDGSISKGFFARETLTLTSSDFLMNFEFGCGELNRGLFQGVAGLIGLGRGKVSLASQASQKYGNVFSYCLPPSPRSDDGFLTFGPSTANSNLKFTRMSEIEGLPFYFVDLVGLSVGGVNLSMPPTVFSDVGTIIDSGTVITRLPMEAYIALRDEFRKQMSKYATAPSPSPIFDTCYNFAGASTIDVPSIEMRYSGGVSVDVVSQGLLFPVSATEGCLAFAGNEDANAVGIVGNMQQLGYEVVYDVGKGVIGFGPGGCS